MCVRERETILSGSDETETQIPTKLRSYVQDQEPCEQGQNDKERERRRDQLKDNRDRLRDR